MERAPGIHWIGGWVGPTAVLNAVVKRKIPDEIRTLIVLPVAQVMLKLVLKSEENSQQTRNVGNA
jgi:hypothetical protein